MRFVHPSYSLCRARLNRRRKVVVRTLDYLDAEQNTVSTNSMWKNPMSRITRKRLLDSVYSWYDTELKKIDMTLDRMNRSSDRNEITTATNYQGVV